MADSQTVVKALLQVDPQFEALCKTMFGPGVPAEDVWSWLFTREGVSKMNPAPSDVSTRFVRNSVPDRVVRRTVQAGRATGRLVRRGAPLVAAGVVGGVIANQLPQNQKDSRELLRRKKKRVAKRDKFVVVDGKTGKRYAFKSSEDRAKALLQAQRVSHPKAYAGSKANLQHKYPELFKADTADVTWGVEFSKVDDEKRQVFGWASIVELAGEPVVDRQGDWISPDEIEKAAYAYVEKSRKGGHQHRRDEWDEPFHASDMIESIVFTDEKVAKMGLPDDFPRGWWVGYQVRDEDTWAKVKKGEVTGFSIHGRGRRQEVPA